MFLTVVPHHLYTCPAPGATFGEVCSSIGHKFEQHSAAAALLGNEPDRSGRNRRLSQKGQAMQEGVTQRLARLEHEKVQRAQQTAVAKATMDVEMGTIGKGSADDKLCAQQELDRQQGQLPVPEEYKDLVPKRNRCGTCNQEGHNSQNCTKMTIYSVIHKHLRKSQTKGFEQAIVLTDVMLDSLAMRQQRNVEDLAFVEPERHEPIYPEGSGPGTFQGDAGEPEVDLTKETDTLEVAQPAKKSRTSAKSTTAKSSTSAKRNSRENDGLEGDPFERLKTTKKSVRGKGRVQAVATNYNSCGEIDASDNDQEIDTSEDDRDLLNRVQSYREARTAGQAGGHTQQQLESDDKSTKK